MIEKTKAKFIIFSCGMGTAIASLLISIYILTVSIMGGTSIVFENNPILAIGEIFLLLFSIATCITATEIYQKYQENNFKKNKQQKN